MSKKQLIKALKLEADRQRACLDKRDYPLTTYAEISHSIDLLLASASKLK